MNVELGQQALLDPEPTRVIRPPDLEPWAWWGVDTSTLRVSIAAITWKVEERGAIQRSVMCHSFTRGPGDGARLDRIYRETFDFAPIMPKPAFVFVEQPFAGKHGVPPVSYMVQGVIMAAIVRATGAVVESVPPPRWKSVALGNGGANKEKVAEWAHLNGCPSGLQDDCDAWAIAEAARRTVRFA